MRSLLFLTATLITASLPAYAQNYTPRPAPAAMAPAGIDSSGSGAIASLPVEVQSSNGVTYINGGISDEEVAEFKAKVHEFNLHVLLNAPRGEFISDVTLTLMDSAGKQLVSISDAGPYFYAKLAPGTYTLNATAATGEKKTATLAIKSSGAVKKELTFREPDNEIVSPHQPTATVD